MEARQSIESRREKRSSNLDRIFDAAKKDTVIRLRWPLVIFSCYLLYYTPVAWLTATQIQTILSLYLLSHATLYFVADELFDSPYFYGPLLIFDTLVLMVALSISGAANPEFYIACIVTLVLSCICNDARGLLIVTLLAPMVYGYFVFSASTMLRPDIYLQLPFPFVISLFYGYFAQVGRIRRQAREKEEQITKKQKAAEDLRRQRERLEVLHEVNLSATSTIDSGTILERFLEKALIHLPYAAAIVRLRDAQSKELETAATKGLETKGHAENGSLTCVDQVVDDRTPLIVRNLFADPRLGNLELFKNEGLVSFISVPLIANNEALGCLVFLTREEHEFGAEEVDYLSTLARQAAIAIHHAQLYRRSQKQAEELRHAHKVKDEFLKVVSNELKTPLNVITGYTDMFTQGLLGEMTPIQEKAIGTITRQAKELNGLINRVLQVSDIESETLQPSLNEINLWEFMSELRSQYELPPAKNIKLVWEYPATLPPIQGDRGKLRRILENLINNAIRFTDHGGVTVSVLYSPARKELEIKVSDTGVGIPEDQQALIFEKFRQGRDATSRFPHSGVGLGLYIVKKYVDVIGGKISVESRLNQGSVFTLRIPVALQKQFAAQEQLLLPTGIDNRTVGLERR
jgi:signal transduction histidine kinase